MLVKIILESKKQNEIYSLAEDIHNSLAGNKDYIDSNIVVNFDNTLDPEQAILFFNADSCQDKEYIRQKAKEAVDLFVDTL